LKVRTTYSKSSADIAALTETEIAGNETNLLIQRAGAAALRDCPDRAACLLCETPLVSEVGFRHREVDYRACPHCGHVQSRAKPPSLQFPPTAYAAVYPPLNRAAAEQRIGKVYRPKLDWALDQADLVGTDRAGLLSRRWFEIGCGAGYFIKALLGAGAGDVGGTEREDALVNRATELLRRPLVTASAASFAETVRTNPADIYVAWFVLEHIENGAEAWRAFRVCPPGTLFLFSVPVFALATLMESMVDGVAARNLDSAVHVQLYTDQSIAHGLKLAGMEPVAEWLFGQDIEDLLRVLTIRLADSHAEEVVAPLLARLRLATDALQGVVDGARLGDARHMLVRRV
jgi:hypothetical protein